MWRRGGGRRRRKRRAVRWGSFREGSKKSVVVGGRVVCVDTGHNVRARALHRYASSVSCSLRRSRLYLSGTTRRRPTPVHAAVRDRRRRSAPAGLLARENATPLDPRVCRGRGDSTDDPAVGLDRVRGRARSLRYPEGCAHQSRFAAPPSPPTIRRRYAVYDRRPRRRTNARSAGNLE